MFVHRLDRDQTLEVPDSTEAEGPFFSPNAQRIAFAVGVSARSGMKGELKKYSLATGLTQSITETADFFGGTWRADGTIFFHGKKRLAPAEGPRGRRPARGGSSQDSIDGPQGRKLRVTLGSRPRGLGGLFVPHVDTDNGEPWLAIP